MTAGGRVALAAAAVTVAVAGLVGLPRLLAASPASTSIVLEPRPPAGEIELTDQSGRPFRLSEQRGMPVLVFFGYTSCTDVCPITLSIWEQAARQLGGDADRIRFVMVSVDPTFDTPERLRAYLGQFDRRFIGLTGPPESVARILDLYAAYAKDQPVEAAHTIAGRRILRHTGVVYAIDRAGRLARVQRQASPAEVVAADVRALLRERETAR